MAESADGTERPLEGHEKTGGPAIAVLADDLSGALASAGKLAACGLRTCVVWHESDPVPAGVQAVVSDLRSRDRDEPPRGSARRHTSAAREAGCKRFELRIDSTLRGYPAEELAGVLEGSELDDPIVLAVPAWPSAGRVAIDGLIRVLDGNGTEVDRLDFDDRVLAGSEVHHLGRSHLMQGPEAIANEIEDVRQSGIRRFVFDSESDRDLEVAAKTAGILEDRKVEMITVSPGAWLALRDRLHPAIAGKTVGSARTNGDFVLVLIGSMTDVNRSGLESLRERSDTVFLTGDPADWPDGFLEAPVLVVPATGQKSDKLVAGPGREAAATAAHVLRVAEGTGRRPSAIIASGGRTASDLMDALGARRLSAFPEAAPLCGMGTIEGGESAGTTLVTKGGRIGDEHTLPRIIETVLNSQNRRTPKGD